MNAHDDDEDVGGNLLSRGRAQWMRKGRVAVEATRVFEASFEWNKSIRMVQIGQTEASAQTDIL